VSIKYQFWGDIFSLTKPKITLMAALVACAGILHANQEFVYWQTLLSLLGISFLVSGSSAFNMYLEREQDKRMYRTKDRPLAAGRLGSFWGVFVALFCLVCACFLLYNFSNFLTLFLGVFSLVIYVFLYTPLKQKTWLSLIIGSVPGAMPVMLGYTTLANNIDFKALTLFIWAFLWQVPHFLAISLFRESEYVEAGFPVLSACFGETFAKVTLLITSWLLVGATIGLYASGVLSNFNLLPALFLGAGFLYICHRGAFTSPKDIWARRAFKASLLYQSLLFLALIVGAF
jgi:heme o synthase